MFGGPSFFTTMTNVDTTMSETDDNDPIGDYVPSTTSSIDKDERNGIESSNMNEYIRPNQRVQQAHHQQQQQLIQQMISSLPENRFELELEFVQAFASPAFVHFLASSRLDESFPSSSLSSSPQQLQSPFQQLQPFLHYLYNTYSQPEYARFLRYPHALYFLESLLVYEDDDVDMDNSSPTTHNSSIHRSYGTNKLWTEWTIPSFRNFCHQQQFLAWQYRHSTCYGVGSITNYQSTNNIDHDEQQQHNDTTTAQSSNNEK
jgi:hypothetical protein